MIPRIAAKRLQRSASEYPVVVLTGPRQSGKTTLCRRVFADYPYATLENPSLREYAVQDPVGFLRERSEGIVLDEVQRAPELLSYIQGIVDESPAPGRFILTGSENLAISDAVSQSLAGRAALHQLWPLSFEEIASSKDLQAQGQVPKSLHELLYTGSYPRIYDRGLDAHDWLGNYVATYVERDVRQVLNVSDLLPFQTFLRLCAGRTAQVLNLSQLGADAGVSHNTAKSWLSVLEATFVAQRLTPYARQLSKRLIKSPKLHFVDTGLVCFLLGIRSPSELETHPLRGAIFETWCVSEIQKYLLNRGDRSRLLFYRDQRGREVDLLLERGSRLVAAEAKSAATVKEEAFKGLFDLADIVEDTYPGGIESYLLYGGNELQSRTRAAVVGWDRLHTIDWTR
ncbi:MAG: ATP-binding protein [Myxococcota bacterium]